MKTNNFMLLSIALFLGTIIYSCKKEITPKSATTIVKENADTCICGDLPVIPGYSLGYNYYNANADLSMPIFNPNNDNEILFINFKSVYGKELTKYNLITKEKTILFIGSIFSRPAWSKQGWIVFVNGYNGLYKVRPDGSDLTLLIADGYQFNPTFNEDGGKFTTFHAFTSGSQFPCKIWNINGNLLDSMNYKVDSQTDWTKQKYFEFRNIDNIFIVDPDTKEIIKTINTYLGSTVINDANRSNEFAWLNENEAILKQNYDVKKVNVWTGEVKKLIYGCQSRCYQFFNINGNGTKAIFNRLTFKQKEANNPQDLLVYHDIMIYDFEKDELTKIEVNL